MGVNYDNMRTMSVPSRTVLSHFGGCKWGYLVFGRKETGAKSVTMATALRVQFVSFQFSWTLMVPSFKNTALIFPEISFIQVFHFLVVVTDLICIS